MPSVRVDILGDSASLKRAYRQAAEASRTFNRSTQTSSTALGGLNKNLEKGRHSMIGFGKSALYAGGALIGAGSLYAGIKKSVEAAEGFNVAQRQLQAQLKANGESFSKLAPMVERVNERNIKLGFTSTQTAQAFTQLDRASGKASVAFRYMAVTADLARARHIDMSKAAILVGKVLTGTTSALNRYGIHIAKGTSVTDALRIAQTKLAGQARAATTPFNQFQAALNNVEIVIGNRLLPVITKYLDRVTEWMSKSRNQKRVADDVARAAGVLGSVIQTVSTAFEQFSAAAGGAKNALELLAAAFVAVKIQARAAALASVAGEVSAIGASAGASAAKVGLLRAALTRLGAIGLITVAIELVLNRKQIEKQIVGHALKDLLGLNGAADKIKHTHATVVEFAKKNGVQVAAH